MNIPRELPLNKKAGRNPPADHRSSFSYTVYAIN